MPVGLFFKLFFFFGILFGFASAAGDGHPGQFKPFAALIFGTGMALGLGYLHTKGSRKAGRPPGDVSVRDELQVPISLSPSEAVPLMRQAVEATEKMELKGGDPSRFRVMAKTPFSWSTYGERIELHAEAKDDGSLVTIKSSPSWPLTMVDNGKGRRNVNQLAGWLASHASPKPISD